MRTIVPRQYGIDSKTTNTSHQRTAAPDSLVPRISRDFDGDVARPEVPVYLWTADKGALTGGFRAGWRDDTNDTVVGVLVDSTFVLLDQGPSDLRSLVRVLAENSPWLQDDTTRLGYVLLQ